MAKVRKYDLPAFLVATVTQAQYERWLRHKARAHVKRDRKRGNPSATNEEYNLAIHRAVIEFDGRDFYTGERLDWSLISTYENNQSKLDGRRYKATFALLPTADHVNDGTGPADFKICSWRTNDAKNDMTLPEFIELCEKVIRHNGDKAMSDTTFPGYTNRNGQTVLRRTELPGSDHLQYVYVLRCGKCGEEYGANGSDIWQRRCPRCGGGREGLPTS